MKRKMIIPFIVCILCSLCILPIHAMTSEDGYIQIESDEISEEQLNNLENDFEIYQFINEIPVFFVQSNTDEDLETIASNYFTQANKGEDGVVLVVGPTEHVFVPFGKCVDLITQEKYDQIWSFVSDTDSMTVLIERYVVQINAALAVSMDQPTIPEERLQNRLVDEANLLTESEAKQLLTLLDEISLRQKLDVVIVTTNDIGYKTVEEYADDFFDYNGYGQGESHDGILLLIDMNDREWHMSTCGYGITAFTDRGLEYIEDVFIDDLSAGNYYEAFTAFANTCDEFITQAKTDKPYDYGHMPKRPFNPFMIPIGLVISIILGFILALIPVKIYKSQLKSVKFATGARNYTEPNGLVLTRNDDIYINSVVTKTPRPKNTSSSSRGGSSTHRSSSGRSHGGRSGRF